MATPMPARKTTSKEVGLVHGFRSGLEEAVAGQLEEAGVDVEYEKYTLEYLKPARASRYTPDFPLPNAIIVETKGRFVTADRQKHRLIQEQHPNLDIRFVFSNPNSRISKTSKTTYAMWCDRYGFKWAKKWIPKEWLEEPATPERVAAAIKALGWKPPSAGTKRLKIK